MKKALLVFIIVINTLILSGCGDYEEPSGSWNVVLKSNSSLAGRKIVARLYDSKYALKAGASFDAPASDYSYAMKIFTDTGALGASNAGFESGTYYLYIAVDDDTAGNLSNAQVAWHTVEINYAHFQVNISDISLQSGSMPTVNLSLSGGTYSGKSHCVWLPESVTPSLHSASGVNVITYSRSTVDFSGTSGAVDSLSNYPGLPSGTYNVYCFVESDSDKLPEALEYEGKAIGVSSTQTSVSIILNQIVN